MIPVCVCVWTNVCGPLTFPDSSCNLPRYDYVPLFPVPPPVGRTTSHHLRTLLGCARIFRNAWHVWCFSGGLRECRGIEPGPVFHFPNHTAGITNTWAGDPPSWAMYVKPIFEWFHVCLPHADEDRRMKKALRPLNVHIRTFVMIRPTVVVCVRSQSLCGTSIMVCRSRAENGSSVA